MGVNQVAMAQLWDVSLKSPVVSSIMELAATWATSSPWRVEIVLKKDAFKKQKTTSYSDDELNYILAQQTEGQLDIAIKHTLTFGFFVVKYRLAERVKLREATSEDIEMTVLHPYEYDLRYTMRKDGRKKWFAFPKGLLFTDAADQKPIPHTRVFIHEEPEPYNGRPNSPLMRCLRTVFQIDELMADAEIIMHKTAFPPFVYQNNTAALAMPEKTSTEYADLGRTETDACPDGTDPSTYGISANQTDLFRQVRLREAGLRIAKKLHEQATAADQLPQQMDALNASTKTYIDDYVESAKTHPTMPTKLLASGLSLDPHVPKPELLKEFSEVEEILKSQISALLGVPVEFLFPQRGRFSADVLLSKKIMSIRNSKLQRWIAVILERVFLDIHYERVLKMIDRAAERFTLDDLKDVNAGAIGAEIFARMGLMLKDRYVRSFKQAIMVTVHFDENTAADINSLLLALQTGVIDHETYAHLALSTLGLGQSLKADLPDKKRKEIEESIRQQQSGKPTEPPAKRKKLGDETIEEAEAQSKG